MSSINLPIGERTRGEISNEGDYKTYSVELSAGIEYAFYVEGISLSDSNLYLLNSSNSTLDSNDDLGPGWYSGKTVNVDSLNSLIYYTPTQSGTYYLEVTDTPDPAFYPWYHTGSFEISAWKTDDTQSTSTSISVGTNKASTIEHELDEDSYKIKLTEGRTYQFEMEKSSLYDPYLILEDSQGKTLAEDNDSGYEINNALITFTAPSTDDFYLIASDAGYRWGTYTLSTKQLNYDESKSTANSINPGETKQGSILYKGDNDWYKINLSSKKGYRFSVEGSELNDPKIQLRDSYGALLAENDNIDTSNDPILNFKPSKTGTFYIDVSDSSDTKTGSYKLIALQTDESASTANNLKVGKSVAGNVQHPKDKDWYAIKLTKNTRYNFNLNSITLKDPELKLRNSSGTLITSDDNSGAGNNASIGFTAATAGTYFLDAGAIQSNDTGTYKLTTVKVIDRDSTAQGAIKLKTNNPTQKAIDYLTDHDWFKLKLKKGRTYHLELKGNTLSDPYLNLRDKKGKILSSDNDSGSGKDAVIRFTPKKSGMHILDASGNRDAVTGSYTIAAWQTDESSKTAKTYKMGRSQSGTIDYQTDEDWFKLKLKPGNYRFDLQGSSLTDPALQLLNSKGKVILSDDDSGKGNDALIAATINKKGLYFLNATASGGDETGTYVINSSLI
ncbi:PPC domain-containing protein [Synechococcus sp. PROS-U-1]|uniref:PPC domain-containing protein n=1 Tax=Synechococcus sp. PROS-U-1 TaxID=1400866 RepID=UPI0016484583|nr:PPC domain-containing protein [Synechococcus sp. PROS-U-1]QNJ01923.1 hemolysin-type calcium-binding repeat family protein [Synechococcus sp. PROS-U-1]